MSSRSELTVLVARALREEAASTTVTPAASAEQAFRDRVGGRGDRRVRRTAASAAAVAAAVSVAVTVALLLAGQDGRSTRPASPAAPVERVATRTLDASVADASAHLAGDGTVVGAGLWFLEADRLVTTDLAGTEVSSEALDDGTDAELVCCLARAGGVVLVPTATGYSHRDAVSRQELATTASAVAGPVAIAPDGVWLRTGSRELSLVGPTTGAVVRTLTTPVPADLVAVADDRLFVAAGATSTLTRLDPVTGAVSARVRLPATPRALTAAGHLVAVADASGRLTVVRADTGQVVRRYQVAAASVGPVPRLAVAGGSLWWSPDAGTVVRLDEADGSLLDAVAVNLDRVWDNALQQRNGLYVTPAGIWVPTRDDGDDFAYHRLPLTLR